MRTAAPRRAATSTVAALVVAAALQVLGPAPAVAASGDLDETFGREGRVELTWDEEVGTEAHASTVLPDGRLVMVGRRNPDVGDLGAAAVAVLSDAGEPHPGFGGGDGWVESPVAGRFPVATAVAARPGGGFVVAGHAILEEVVRGFALAYGDDGTPDAKFGRDGVADLGTGFAPTSLVVRPDGSVVVAGSTGLPSAADVARQAVRLVGLTATGAPDDGFGSDGGVTSDLGGEGNDSVVNALVRREDGTLAGAGHVVTDGVRVFLLVRYTADGDLISATKREIGERSDAVALALAVGPGGTFVATGYVAPEGKEQWATARFDATGDVDPTFGTEGVVVGDLATQARAKGVAVGSGGAILVGGTSAGFGQYTLARYTADGVLDPDFSEDGVVAVPMSRDVPHVASMAVGGGRATLVGNSGDQMAAARFVDVLGWPPAAPAASVGDATAVDEGGDLHFPVTLAAAPSRPVTVRLATSDGTAQAPGDYTARDVAIGFAPGQTTADFVVGTATDGVTEDDETVTVTVLGGSGTTVGSPSSATGTIRDVPPPPIPVGSVGPASAEEGQSLVFPVTLDRAGADTVTLTVATQDGTAEAPGDYTATTTTLTFPPGTTAASFTVPTARDNRSEGDETVQAWITGGSGTVSAPPTPATGTITDATPVATVGAATAAEGGTLSFPVTLSRPSPTEVWIRLTTSDGSATAPGDYTAVGQPGTTLTFPPGTTSQTFTVTTARDRDVEPDETVRAQVSAGGGLFAVGNYTATGTITDATPVATVGTAEAFEGGSLGFPVTLDRPSDVTITLKLVTGDATAVAPADYTAVGQPGTTLTFPPGVTSRTFVVDLAGDTVQEGDETLRARIFGGSGPVALGTSQATGTVHDVVLVAGEHLVTGEVTGTVRFQEPGSAQWVVLDHATPLPLGAVVDTSRGSVVLRFVVPRPPGRAARAVTRTQSVTVAGSMVRTGQRRSGRPVVTLQGGRFTRCATARRTALVTSARPVDVVARVAGATLLAGRVRLTDRCRTTTVAVLRGAAWAWPVRHPDRVVRIGAGRSRVFRR